MWNELSSKYRMHVVSKTGSILDIYFHQHNMSPDTLLALMLQYIFSRNVIVASIIAVSANTYCVAFC